MSGATGPCSMTLSSFRSAQRFWRGEAVHQRFQLSLIARLCCVRHVGHMSDRIRVPLKLLAPLGAGYAIDAPPALCASSKGINFGCARCSTVLLQAEHEQV